MGVLRIAESVLQRARRSVPDGELLLTGRAGLLGLTGAGQVSAGGATRLLRTRDGWCALTLSRPDDLAAVPALLEADEVDDDPWPAIQRWAARRSAAAVAERGRLLDLPIAVLGETVAQRPRVHRIGPSARREPDGLLVADLSSMWAGPLCGRLLAGAGATVVKVESPRRPDGTRAGDRRFFDWMNSGKLSCALDFNRDQAALRDLLGVADVVLEGSRPAALTRRGLDPHQVPPRPGRVWLRVSGYGTAGDRAGRVAFGDDAAVAGGLVCRDGAGAPGFMGDAIADPLTGIEAFAAVQDSLQRGGGELIEVAMAAVAADYAAGDPVDAGGCREVHPRVPEPSPAAAELGADSAAVVRLVAERMGAPC